MKSSWKWSKLSFKSRGAKCERDLKNYLDIEDSVETGWTYDKNLGKKMFTWSWDKYRSHFEISLFKGWFVQWIHQFSLFWSAWKYTQNRSQVLKTFFCLENYYNFGRFKRNGPVASHLIYLVRILLLGERYLERKTRCYKLGQTRPLNTLRTAPVRIWKTLQKSP